LGLTRPRPESPVRAFLSAGATGPGPDLRPLWSRWAIDSSPFVRLGGSDRPAFRIGGWSSCGQL